MKTNRKGFTLVELIVVIAIMAIVGVVAVPTASSILKDMDKRACQTSLDSLKSYWVMNKKLNGTKNVSLAEFVAAFDSYKNDASYTDAIVAAYKDEFDSVTVCKQWVDGESCYTVSGNEIVCAKCGATSAS